MTEQIITFETAKLAKIKGFWLTAESWRESMTFYRGETKKGNGIGWLIESAMGNDCDLKSDDCYAPTQALLQQWLRDTHLIHPYIVPIGDGKTWHIPNIRKISANLTDYLNGDIIYTDRDNQIKYNSYEEALEVALKLALQSIAT